MTAVTDRAMRGAPVLTIGGLALGSALYLQTGNANLLSCTREPPGPNWFYCRSPSVLPNTQACPEGWVTVTPA